MKKLIALAMVCGFALTFVACGGGSKETSNESTADTTMTAPDTTATDTTASDTTAAN
jgi:hypothetical protein